jgi:quinol monooxygenase YgiN
MNQALSMLNGKYSITETGFSYLRAGDGARARLQRARFHEGVSPMSATSDLDTTGTDGLVIGVVKVKVDAADVEELVAEAIAVLAAESRDLHGFLAAQILVSLDNKTIVFLTEWSDQHAWGQSRYHARVGEITERLYIKSTTIEFETYTRRANFTPDWHK